MSRKALWAPRELNSWDWRAAIIEERQPQRLPFKSWRRPEQTSAGTDPEKSNRIEPSTLAIWLGFSVAGLAAMVFALSAIYGQMVTALTGVAAPSGFPAQAIVLMAGSGLLLGAVGIVLRSRRQPLDEGIHKQDKRPDTPIAA